MLQSFSSFKVAQQEAQRAAFVVDRAIQEKQQKIVQVRLYTCSMLDLQIFFYERAISNWRIWHLRKAVFWPMVGPVKTQMRSH